MPAAFAEEPAVPVTPLLATITADPASAAAIAALIAARPPPITKTSVTLSLVMRARVTNKSQSAKQPLQYDHHCYASYCDIGHWAAKRKPHPAGILCVSCD
jgi:hypothetical protein